MNFIFLFFFLVFTPGLANAQTSAGQAELTPSVPSKEESSSELEVLKEYAKNQQQRQQRIQLLSLDLDEAKLELELRQKKVELGKLSGLGSFSSNSALKSSGGPDNKIKAAVVNDFDPEVKTVFVTDFYKEAVLGVDGNEITVKEGDKLGTVTVKEITPNGVVLLKEDNQQVKIAIK